MVETLLTVEQYAERAQLHPDSVRRQLREGRLRAIKKGRVWRIPESVVGEDSRQRERSEQWARAARAAAPIYAASLESGDDFTAFSTAPGDVYQIAEGSEE